MIAPSFSQPLLQVRDLEVTLDSGIGIVGDISFSVDAGEIVGVVGESGSGKTSIATALLGDVRAGAVLSGGSVLIDGQDLLALPSEALRRARGAIIAHVPQDPATALNPMARIGAALHEMLAIHQPDLAKTERDRRIAEAAHDVGLPATPEFLRRFPHQLSGGQQQRVLLALAIVLRPKLIVLDEPTTALDVTTQARVLATLRQLCRSRGIGAIYVSHDLAVVRELVDRVVVLYAGRVAESGSREQIFDAPAHPYTRGLLDAVPDIAGQRAPKAIPGYAPALHDRSSGCAFAPRCVRRTQQCVDERPALRGLGERHLAACHHAERTPAPPVRFTPPAAAQDTPEPLLMLSDVSVHYGANQILFDVTLGLPRGRCTALVGESGSGKTTLARTLIGLVEDAQGTLLYAGEALPLRGNRPRELRQRVQYIFQNPYRALNPRHTVGEILRAAARHFFPIDRSEADQRVAAALERVALPAELAMLYPRSLSGGERQRIAIARALICEPELLICDEITSALDVSVQAAILSLLQQLQSEGLTILFVTHDLAVVRAIADDVAVLRGGRIVEHGPAAAVLDTPAHDYTRTLVSDSPRLRAAAAG